MTDLVGNSFLDTLFLLSDTQIQDNGRGKRCSFTK